MITRSVEPNTLSYAHVQLLGARALPLLSAPRDFAFVLQRKSESIVGRIKGVSTAGKKAGGCVWVGGIGRGSGSPRQGMGPRGQPPSGPQAPSAHKGATGSGRGPGPAFIVRLVTSSPATPAPSGHQLSGLSPDGFLRFFFFFYFLSFPFFFLFLVFFFLFFL